MIFPSSKQHAVLTLALVLLALAQQSVALRDKTARRDIYSNDDELQGLQITSGLKTIKQRTLKHKNKDESNSGKGNKNSSSSSKGGGGGGERGKGVFVGNTGISSPIGQADDIRTLKFTNLAFQQPLGPFIVIVHDDTVPPLFTLGEPATMQLQELAENGSAQGLFDFYNRGWPGVAFVGISDIGAPYTVGGSYTIDLPSYENYPYVTVASMALNTNDGFVAINGMHMYVGDRVYGPVYDAGTEINNELCASVPGPACLTLDPGNVASGNGEGVVHIHRGIHGVGNLPPADYDWKNPLVLFELM